MYPYLLKGLSIERPNQVWAISIYCSDPMLATSVIERSALMGCDREITPCCGSSGVTIVALGASSRVGFGGRLIQAAVGSISGRGGPCVKGGAKLDHRGGGKLDHPAVEWRG